MKRKGLRNEPEPSSFFSIDFHRTTVFFSSRFGKATGSVRCAGAFDACGAAPIVVLLTPPPPGPSTTGFGFGRIGVPVVVGSLFFGISICGRLGPTSGLVVFPPPIGPPGLGPV